METATEVNESNKVSSMTTQPETPQRLGLGARLKSAREAMNLTEKEAAARLYLNVNIITGIEKDSLSAGPSETFMRGYVRSYARLLNFPEHEIKSALDTLEITPAFSRLNTPILHAIPRKRHDRYLRWITYLVIFTLIVLVSIWWNSHANYVITDVPTRPIENQTPVVTKTNPEPAITPPVNTIPVQPSSPAVIPPFRAPAMTPLTPNQLLMPPNEMAPVADSATQPAPKRAKHRHHKKLSNMAISLPEPGLENR